MRATLSDLIVKAALSDPKIIVLSGDHGYALFDEIRSKAPSQFVNVGVMEQAMVGFAAGLAKVGFKPIVYGLSAFVPIRVLEQVKLDVCYSNLPVIFLGDGAGLVYSTLGSSHQCGEDIAALRPLANISIYSPADADELTLSFAEALKSKVPAYIRIGKSDRPEIKSDNQKDLNSYVTNNGKENSLEAFVATGSMVSIANQIAKKLNLPCISVPQIKPFPSPLSSALAKYKKVYVFEEHSRNGGLTSSILDAMAETEIPMPQFKTYSLKNAFSKNCGSYQYALSEHGISDKQLMAEFNIQEF